MTTRTKSDAIADLFSERSTRLTKEAGRRSLPPPPRGAEVVITTLVGQTVTLSAACPLSGTAKITEAYLMNGYAKYAAQVTQPKAKKPIPFILRSDDIEDMPDYLACYQAGKTLFREFGGDLARGRTRRRRT